LELNHCKPPFAKAWEDYVNGCAEPWLIHYLALRGRSFEAFGVHVIRLHRLLEKKQPRPVQLTADTIGDELIAGLPAAAYDVHTHEGKRSFAYFSTACDSVRKFYAEHKLGPVKTLGAVVFHLEGRHLYQQLEWEGRREFVCEGWKVGHSAHGFENIEQVNQLQAIVGKHRAELNQARRRIVIEKGGT